MEVSIRKASIQDAEIIADYNVKMALETEELALDPAIVLAGVYNVFNDAAKGFYLVAEAKGEIVACLMITYEWSDWRNATWWWIQSVYVHPDMRGQRVYKQMYQYLKRQVKANAAICGLRLYVDKRNLRAQKVYQKLGMTRDHYELYEEEL
jgi:GNAT superfamily N-acetyltransferase